MSKVLERTNWETVTAWIFIATSLSAFVLVLFLPNLVIREMRVWVPVQAWYWSIFWASITSGSGSEALYVTAFLMAVNSRLITGPEIWVFYNYYSLLLISLGLLGPVAAIGLLRIKKWRTYVSFVYCSLAFFVICNFGTLEMITVPKITILLLSLPFLLIYAYIWGTFMSKIMPKEGEKRKNAGGTPPT